jgi:hypothetical protein
MRHRKFKAFPLSSTYKAPRFACTILLPADFRRAQTGETNRQLLWGPLAAQDHPEGSSHRRTSRLDHPFQRLA